MDDRIVSVSFSCHLGLVAMPVNRLIHAGTPTGECIPHPSWLPAQCEGGHVFEPVSMRMFPPEALADPWVLCLCCSCGQWVTRIAPPKAVALTRRDEPIPWPDDHPFSEPYEEE